MKFLSYLSPSFRRTALLLALISPGAGGALAQNAGEYSLAALAPLSCEQMVDKLNAGLEKKDPQALYSVGVLYEEGSCVARDPARAAYMMRGALNAGHVPAAAALALLTGLGEGVPQDYAAAGALLAKAGVKLGDEPVPAGPDADYTRGYAYTWLRVAQRELKYPKELSVTGTRGVADLEFEPRSGQWKAGAFRKTSSTEDVTVGSIIDRSRGVAAGAIDQAARAAAAKVPAPDSHRVVAGSYSTKLTLAPAGDDGAQASVRVLQMIGNTPRTRFGLGN